MDSNAATESDISLKSRSFLHRVNDRVRKILDQFFKRCNARKRLTFFNIGNVHIFDIVEASVLMGKNNSENLHSIKNTGNNLTMKQIFDISAKLIVEQSDGIFGVYTISWEDSPWRE